MGIEVFMLLRPWRKVGKLPSFVFAKIILFKFPGINVVPEVNEKIEAIDGFKDRFLLQQPLQKIKIFAVRQIWVMSLFPYHFIIHKCSPGNRSLKCAMEELVCWQVRLIGE